MYDLQCYPGGIPFKVRQSKSRHLLSCRVVNPTVELEIG